MKRMKYFLLMLVLCVPTCAHASEADIQELQERIAVLEYRVETLEAMIMGSNPAGVTTQNEGEEAGELESMDMLKEAPVISNIVNKVLETETFASWQQLYTEFTGEEAKAPEVTHVMRYTLEDFDGAKVDCYLVDVSADVAFWVNQEAQQGAVDDSFQILMDTKTMKYYDNITMNAGNEQPDTATEEGRVKYLLGVYGSLRDDSFSGNLVNDMETITETPGEGLEEINTKLG